MIMTGDKNGKNISQKEPIRARKFSIRFIF